MNEAMKDGNVVNVNAEGEPTVINEPIKGGAPALAAFMLGGAAVGAAIAGLPWQLFLIIGLMAVIAGSFAMVRTGTNRANRLAELTGMAGLLLGGFTMVAALLPDPTMTTCRKTGNLATATALEMAIINFRTEYGTLPNAGRNIVTTDSPTGVRLLKILLGIEDSSALHQNNRDIKFLSVREGKNRRKGLIYTKDGSSVEGLFDEYGNGYIIVIQSKHGEPLHVPSGKKMIELKGRDCAVFSPGKDGKPGTTDDVKTW